MGVHRPSPVFIDRGTKVCRCCQEEKPFRDFHANRSAPGGLKHECKSCGLTLQKKRKLSGITRVPRGIRTDKPNKSGRKRIPHEQAIDLEGEEWRPIPGTDYAVSSTGRVKCLVRRRYVKPNDLIQQSDSCGYKCVNVSSKTTGVHVLVCTAFNGPRPSPLYEVAHNNGNRSDNHSTNLRWATRKENAADVLIHGTANPPKGTKNGHAVLHEKDIPTIRARLEQGHLQKEIAADFGVARTTINAIANGYNWGHL